MKTLKSDLFKKSEIKKEELIKVHGCGVKTPCGPAYDGSVEYRDYCADDGTLTYEKCQ
ncbi:hypothetical protein [Ancylomarina longa]|uniref:hypothetical protein n=1 Tax=Ancylomarina longa TaxID=2487017 RepID=UPI001ADDE969|nr:hypothetical protein [Ancylomarina longa]